MRQHWKKIGLIYNSQSYCSVPIAIPLSQRIIRIIFSTRDIDDQSLPFAIDYNLYAQKTENEFKVNVNLGLPGTFDENGIMPSCFIIKDQKISLYYIGWTKRCSKPFRNAIGLMTSENMGKSFIKYSVGPILDRGIYDNCFVASNCVIKDNDIYKMYYLSCDKWIYEKGNLKHYYNIKYAESKDGIHWDRAGHIAIDYKNKDEYAISVPRVVFENSTYKMWYSYRASPKGDTYRIGYAESEDGKNWGRMDELVELDVSPNGWDSEMICYPYIFDHGRNRYMLYNGNGYGETGIGLAVLERD